MRWIGLTDGAVNEEVARAFNVTPPFRLEDFTYSSDKLMEIMFSHLSNTSFDGITVGLEEPFYLNFILTVTIYFRVQ